MNGQSGDRRSYTDLEDKIDALEDRVARLEVLIVNLTKSIEELVSAWTTAKGLVFLIKLSASLVAAAGVLYAAFHNPFGK